MLQTALSVILHYLDNAKNTWFCFFSEYAVLQKVQSFAQRFHQRLVYLCAFGENEKFDSTFLPKTLKMIWKQR